MTGNRARLLVWQLIDSGFPSGGFAHSGGIEAAMHHGRVFDVGAFAGQTLRQAGRSALPFVTAAWRRPGDLADLDRLSDIFLSNPVANRASRAQGQALVSSSRQVFPEPALMQVCDNVQQRRLAPHHAPVFGAVMQALDVDLPDAQRAFLFAAVRGVASAAVRLGLVGGYEAQAIQHRLASEIDAVATRSAELDPEEVAQTAPLIDLFQSTHDRLYSRLFQS